MLSLFKAVVVLLVSMMLVPPPDSSTIEKLEEVPNKEVKLLKSNAVSLPPPHSITIEKLSKNQKSKSKILKSAEYKAPIPDELSDRFEEVEVLETKSGVKIKLEIPPETDELKRLPGPSYAWPHGNCYMCLGNILITKYGQSKEYLDKIGSKNWGILYDNLNNDPSFEGVKGSNEGYYGSSGHRCQRRGILGRIFRR